MFRYASSLLSFWTPRPEQCLSVRRGHGAFLEVLSLPSFLPLPASPPRFPAYCSPLSLSLTHSAHAEPKPTFLGREEKGKRCGKKVEWSSYKSLKRWKNEKNELEQCFMPRKKNDRRISLEFDEAEE